MSIAILLFKCPFINHFHPFFPIFVTISKGHTISISSSEPSEMTPSEDSDISIIDK